MNLRVLSSIVGVIVVPACRSNRTHVFFSDAIVIGLSAGLDVWAWRGRDRVADEAGLAVTSLLLFLLGAVAERQFLRRVLDAIGEVRH